MAQIELSFCIPLMNRFEDIKATLPKNLEDNRGSIGRVEFILVCFDSDDLVEKWVKNNFNNDIESGFLCFYRSSELDIWHFGRAKNSFKNIINGRIYASLDGDNYTGFKGGEHIINVFQTHEYNCIFHQFQGDWGDGTCGRVSFKMEDYIEIGYDNDLLPRQWDELDAMLSIMVKHPERKYVCYQGKSIIDKSFPFRRFVTENALSPVVVEINEKLNPLHGRIQCQSLGLHKTNYVDEDAKLKYSNIFNHLSSFFKNTYSENLRNQYVLELQDIQRTMIEVIEPIILEKWTLRRQDNNGLVKINENDMILLSCVKDEPDLKDWYNYYKDLGVTKFFMVDDYSAHPVKHDLEYDDVYIWHPIVGRFRYAKVFWLEILLSCYCRGNWCITVDSDEYISLPDFPDNPEKEGQSVLRRYIDVGMNKGIEYFAGFILDVFPGLNNFGRMVYHLDKCDFTNYQYRPPTLTEMYKQSNTVRWSYGENYTWVYQIDIRYRLNRGFDSLRKFPVFKYHAEIHLNQGFHDLIIGGDKRNSSELNRSDIIPIIHYKLRGLLLQKITGLQKDPRAYHQETSRNLNRIIDRIESCILKAMISPFSHKYLGYNLMPIPNCQEILIQSGDKDMMLSDIECVDRTTQKIVYVKSDCQPYLKGYYIFGRSFLEVINWIRQVTPFSQVKSLNQVSALLSKETNMDDFMNYLNNVPKLHTWDGGVTWTTGGFNSDQLNEIYIFLKNHGDGLHFIETGAGNSTLLFSFLNPTKVVSIAPDQELFDRILRCMQAYHLDSSKLQMIKDFSEWALPKLAESSKIKPIFDVCFIDGDHNYPSVFLDFFYMNYMMKQGGILFVDDLQIYSCNQLSEFLLHERDFQLVFDIGKLRAYQRTSERRVLSGWKSGYNLKMMNK